jgi:hypothetical protein
MQRMSATTADDREGGTVAEPQSNRYLAAAAEIADLAAKDQEMRRAAVADPSRWDAEVDRRHAARMKEIIAEIGWPTVSKVGRRAAHQAWLLVQHADHDVDFQRECLRLMNEAPEGEVSSAGVAYLEDRVRVNEGRPQRYGTQFHTNERGELVPRPIEDPEGLDQRRQAAGLERFAQYQQRIRTR